MDDMPCKINKKSVSLWTGRDFHSQFLSDVVPLPFPLELLYPQFPLPLPLPFEYCPLPFEYCPLPFEYCPLPFEYCPLPFETPLPLPLPVLRVRTTTTTKKNVSSLSRSQIPLHSTFSQLYPKLRSPQVQQRTFGILPSCFGFLPLPFPL